MDYKAIETAAKGSGFNDLLVFDNGLSTSMLENFGLVMNKGYPKIGKAEPLKMLVKVPGGGILNLSKSLDGQVHYVKRTITAQFSCFRPKSEWGEIRDELEKFHGQWLWFAFKSSSWYWRGQISVSMESKGEKVVVTFTAVCNPYSYNMTAFLGDEWLWDSFNFEEDSIYTTPTEVKRL